ncbi:hypothetical protein NPIL_327091 [Nephila pilipes]|uniref:Uncharacterized protein n=1 Tax=Nephila pilipes TaxID=299642 RepID=A0A8X6TCF5_NEPPI|nr:hypothetical protein NPIL_327091 [Nephila pilipes]
MQRARDSLHKGPVVSSPKSVMTTQLAREFSNGGKPERKMINVISLSSTLSDGCKMILVLSPCEVGIELFRNFLHNKKRIISSSLT